VLQWIQLKRKTISFKNLIGPPAIENYKTVKKLIDEFNTQKQIEIIKKAPKEPKDFTMTRVKGITRNTTYAQFIEKIGKTGDVLFSI